MPASIYTSPSFPRLFDSIYYYYSSRYLRIYETYFISLPKKYCIDKETETFWLVSNTTITLSMQTVPNYALLDKI